MSRGIFKESFSIVSTSRNGRFLSANKLAGLERKLGALELDPSRPSQTPAMPRARDISNLKEVSLGSGGKQNRKFRAGNQRRKSLSARRSWVCRSLQERSEAFAPRLLP